VKQFWVALLLVLVVGTSAFADHVAQSDIIPDVPRDGIPPLDNPRYDLVSKAGWLADDDWVLAFERNGDARAYPVKIMNWHEIVNDTVGGLEVLISYCPLCRSGLVFDRHLDAADVPEAAQSALPKGTLLSFGNTGSLYESDMVMYDRNSDSQWYQIGGEALIGPLHGTTLKRLPASMLSWGQFKTIYPGGSVLSRDTGYTRAYTRDIFAGYNRNPKQLFFPVTRVDDRLPAKSHVLGLSFGKTNRAYNLSSLEPGVYADEVEGQAVVLFVEGGAGVAFDPQIEGKALAFSYEDGQFVDPKTGSVWDFAGKAVSGKLRGAQLQRLVQSNLFWFSWATLYPDSDVLPELADFTPYSVVSNQAQALFPTWAWWLVISLVTVLGVWALRPVLRR